MHYPGWNSTISDGEKNFQIPLVLYSRELEK
jgi:hypothetical protein